MEDSILPNVKLPGGVSSKATEYKELARKGDKWESPVFSIGSAKKSTDIPSAPHIENKAHSAGPRALPALPVPVRRVVVPPTTGAATGIPLGATNGATNGAKTGYGGVTNGISGLGGVTNGGTNGNTATVNLHGGKPISADGTNINSHGLGAR
ncbi:hypothetical protein ACCO45_000530 [Purpureocillium lilacinum]|uniref:Uncharacterized protein n=1 Tax=Purpureocillium lilacinum TaxID=33203 RepID=A0ACC4E4G4_PURLI